MQKAKQAFYLILIHWTLVGCQNGFDARGINSFHLSSVEASLNGPENSDNEAVHPPPRSCFDNTQVNACLIFKNHITANNGPIYSSTSFSSDLTDFQTFEVNIEGTDSSGYLQNSDVKINITDGQRIKRTNNGDWKYTYKNNDSHRALAQTTSYYVINTTIQYLIARGGNPTQNLQLPVDALDMSVENNAYFNLATESIRIGYAHFTDFQQELALSTEVVIHEYGHAAMLKASGGATKYFNTNTNKRCISESSDLCCANANGCSVAIDEGAADVLAVFMYPDNPGIGNVLSNDIEGLSQLGVSRNVDSEMSLTKQQAFNAPGAFNSAYSDYNGEIHVMGVVYSSAWRLTWLSAKDAGLSREIEEIFLEHLSSMTGNDTFSTALDKILTIDRAFYKSRHQQRFLDAFATKGISPTIRP